MPTETFSSYTKTTWNVPKDQTLTIRLYGAGGGDGEEGNNKKGLGGTGGYVEVTYNATYGEALDIWAGEAGNSSGNGGIGYFDGGAGGAGEGSAGGGGGGGGATAIENGTDTLLAVADAGGGGAGGDVFSDDGGAGGGGARGGSGGAVGGAAKTEGDDGGGSGFGGDGADADSEADGGDGGTEVNLGSTVTETAGGGNDSDGLVEIDYEEITPPQSVSTTVNYNATVDITWTDNSNFEQSYEIYRATSNNVTASDTLVVSVGANVTSYTDTPPSDDTYYYRVRAVNPYSETISPVESQSILATVKYYNGTSWVRRVPKYYDGVSWTVASNVSGRESGQWK